MLRPAAEVICCFATMGTPGAAPLCEAAYAASAQPYYGRAPLVAGSVAAGCFAAYTEGVSTVYTLQSNV